MARALVVELVGRSDKLKKTLDTAEKQTESFGKKTLAMAKKAGPAVAAVGAGFTALGAGLDEANGRLKVAIANNDKLTKVDVSRWQKDNQRAFQLSGISIREQNEAMAAAIQSGADMTQTTNILAAANELAAAKGIDFQQATDEIVKIMAGKGKRTLDEFGLGTLQGEEAVAALEERLRGTSATLDKTFSGRLNAAKTIALDYAASIGTKVGPALAGLGGIMTGLPAIFSAVGTAITGVRTAMTFLAANPLILGILAGGAIIAGLIVLEKKFGLVSKAVDGLKEAFSNLWPAVKSAINVVLGGLEAFANGAIAAVTAPVGVLNKIPGVKSLVPDVPKVHLPRLHQGGTVPGIPGTDVLTVLQAGEQVTPRRAAGGMTVNVVVQGSVIAERDLGRTIVDALRDAGLVGVAA